ncbi:signal peptide peptidase SppA [Granulicella tundricola]|uniref:Signal peptide peptidase SppA, 36K type n=1 Tax=Granulicella tundricola (strain ATCC BAA-1859 / DSM 23138 / MP5ACTX9) TaxID=1198114 RepID=E8WWF0_GRATM|nr:signal peptide peptidase SppA [Granulicella tundricola]ADW69614.1 signal peptide peptidase SppA, 36K type [Granulicella tundricola MP5ACTX9]
MPDDLNQAPPPPQPPYVPQNQASAFPPQQPAFGSPYGNAGGYANPYGYPARPPRSAWFWPSIILGSIVVVVGLFGAIVWSAAKSLGGDTTATTTFATSEIAVIDIDGVILDADKVDSQLRKFGDDSSVKAIILHINSPGGGAAASQEIYHEVLRVRQEKHKKIVASVESVGASGAYYIASACDKIYANQASVVGSIGVIMEWTNYGDLMKWAKLKPVVIHAGELKDAGDPSRDMTPKEAAYFQALTDNMYGQFVRDVAAGRHTSTEKIQPLATGQVWTGEQSLPLGLIDKIGGFRVALMDTAHDVGISGEPAIVKPNSAKKGLAGLLSGEGDDLFPNPTKLLDHAPGFYFMWK